MTDPNTPKPDVVLQPPAPPRKKKDKPVTYYQIEHTAVGEWRTGEVVAVAAFKGLDIERLVALGAIAPTDAPESDDE